MCYFSGTLGTEVLGFAHGVYLVLEIWGEVGVLEIWVSICEGIEVWGFSQP